MKRQIHTLLQYPKEQYDMFVFSNYFFWCQDYSLNTKHHQLLITNQKLYSWFMRQYQKNEKRFLDYIKDYKDTANMTDELRDLYDKITVETNFYPKALLNEISKRAKKGVRITDKQFQSNLN